jgi:hypothetical protein
VTRTFGSRWRRTIHSTVTSASLAVVSTDYLHSASLQ